MIVVLLLVGVLFGVVHGQSLFVSYHGGSSPAINNIGVFDLNGNPTGYLIKDDDGLRELRGIVSVASNTFLFANAYTGNSTLLTTDCSGTYLNDTTTQLLSHPYGIAFDPTDGTTYVTNQDTDNVISFQLADPQGTVAQFASADTPRGIAVDPTNGLVFVASETAGVLVFKKTDGSSPIATISINKPIGVFVDVPNNLLYVSSADSSKPVVKSYSTTSFSHVKSYSTASFTHPCGLSVYQGTLYVLVQSTGQLVAFSVAHGTATTLISSFPDTPEQLLIATC